MDRRYLVAVSAITDMNPPRTSDLILFTIAPDKYLICFLIARSESADSQCIVIALHQIFHSTLIQYSECVSIYCYKLDAVLDVLQTSDGQWNHFQNLKFGCTEVFFIKFFMFSSHVRNQITFIFPRQLFAAVFNHTLIFTEFVIWIYSEKKFGNFVCQECARGLLIHFHKIKMTIWRKYQEQFKSNKIFCTICKEYSISDIFLQHLWSVLSYLFFSQSTCRYFQHFHFSFR